MAVRGEKEYSQSVDNSIRLLRCFIDKEERGISELSRELDMSKASVSRIVAALERGRFLMQNPDTGRYRLGIGLMFFGELVHERNELARALSPLMHDLAEKYQSTTHLAVISGSDVMIISKVSAGPFVYMRSHVGGKLPPYCTSTGKCLLAFMQPEDARYCLEKLSFCAMTSKTITDMPTLQNELELVRRRGYAVDDEESHEGLYCVGCPVFDAAGHVIAAISVSGRRDYLMERQEEVSSYINGHLIQLKF